MSKFRLSWRALAIRLGLIAGQPVNKLGIQFQIDDGEVLRYNREIRPRSWQSINVLKRDFLEQLHADNPGALGILRLYPDSDWQPEPERRAEEHILRIQREAGHVLDLFGAVEDNNEYIHAHHPDEMVQDADRYMERFIQLCGPELGLKPVVLNAATGNWGDDIARFPRMLLALQRYGGYLGFHEYDWPTLWRAHQEGIAAGNGGMWHALRWKRAARAARAFLSGWAPPFIITEAGLERAVIPGQGHAGWRTAYDDFDQAVENYIQSWAWYYSQLDDDVHSVNIFVCGGVTPWGDFDIKGVTPLYEAIKSFPVVKPPEPEPPEPGGSMDIKVVDLEYNERDLEYAQSKYGVAFRRAEVEPGQLVYRLVELWEKTGTSGLGTQVLDEGGRPMANVDVAFYWPDAPDPPDPPTSVYDHDWHPNFVHGPTNVNGDIAPGMGRGAYHGIGEGGPHAVWVRDPNIPSDICEKLGMLAGTFHDHLDQKFQLMVEGEQPPSNGGEPVKELKIIGRQEVTPWPSAEMVLRYPADIAVDTRGQARITGWDPDNYDPDLELPFDMDGMAAVKNCCDFEGIGAREYQLMVTEYGSSAPITPVCKEVFQPKPDFRQVIFTVDWVEEEPTPEPPSESPAAQIRQVADNVHAELYGIAASLEAGGVTGGRLFLRLSDDSEVEFSVVPKAGASAAQRLVAGIMAHLAK